jgi:hypothetical protein
MACQSLFRTESAHVYVVTVISTNVRTTGLVHPVTAGHVAYRKNMRTEAAGQCSASDRITALTMPAIAVRGIPL